MLIQNKYKLLEIILFRVVSRAFKFLEICAPF